MEGCKINLEICVFTIAAAMDAGRAGADRIELCSGQDEGGLTPGYAFIEKAVEKVSIPVFPIIRPRPGDFRYSDCEFEMMKRDIAVCKELGCRGVTFSILLPDNRVDEERTAELVGLAAPMEVTFIRGFDLTPDPFEALETLKRTGCRRVLTSGQAYQAPVAAGLLHKLVKKAGEDIIVMPGSGINDGNLEFLINKTGAHEYHASARKIRFGRETPVDGLGFGRELTCDTGMIRRMRVIADY